MKMAAVQMVAELAKVDVNLKMVRRLATKAFKEGAECVILPEFFTSAIAFHHDMLKVARDINGEPMQLLKELAAKYNGMIGGSFIAIRGDDCYNTFVLVFPDGKSYFHNKDQPTMWENCYYVEGTDDGVLETKVGNIGVALCWEFIRTRTAKRLLGRVDVVVGGSCWWTISEKPLSGFSSRSHELNVKIQKETPAKFARMLGVPVIYASHAGNFEGEVPNNTNLLYKSHYLGETQIVDGNGKQLAHLKREDGEGIIIADVDIEKKWKPSEQIPDGFWIPELPGEFILSWEYLNKFGVKYYQIKSKLMKQKIKKE